MWLTKEEQRNVTITVTNLGKLCGMLEYPSSVFLDLRHVDNPIDTFVHEILHRRFPDLSEKQIQLLEKETLKQLTLYQRWQLLQFIARKAVLRGDDDT